MCLFGVDIMTDAGHKCPGSVQVKQQSSVGTGLHPHDHDTSVGT